jgi:hypothetical protein
MVARIRKISLSFFALANAITIPNIPTAKKYNPYPFSDCSPLFVLMCHCVDVRWSYTKN